MVSFTQGCVELGGFVFSKIVLALFGKPGNPRGPELGGMVHQEVNINQHIVLICFAFLKHMQDTSMDKEAWFTRRPGR